MRGVGSSVMRSEQLSEHMRRYFDDRYEIRRIFVSRATRRAHIAWLKFWYPHSIFVFSKNAARIWREDDLLDLRRDAQAILVDYVDSHVNLMLRGGVDVHLSTSIVGAGIMKAFMATAISRGESFQGRVEVVLHNYDVAIREGSALQHGDHAKFAYLGSRAEAATTPLSEQMVTFLDSKTREAFQRSIVRLGEFNAHYCIRRNVSDDPGRIVKPFTKGATAAACGAAILTDRNTDDAVALLGDDYPFMIAGNSPVEIDDGLRRMADAFGGPEWLRAMERVAALHERTSHKEIATQLHRAIESVT